MSATGRVRRGLIVPTGDAPPDGARDTRDSNRLRSPRATGGPIASAVRSRIRTRSCERGERRDLTRAFAKGTNVILRNHFAA